ncbi:MAG: hypothetical protein WC023_01640 [Rhodocyclaceae bacterium]
MSEREIVEAIAVTAELTQTQLTGSAMAVMADDLMRNYPAPAILQALTRCRRELPGRLTQHAIIERIEQADGRPGANEAWGIALTAFDEAATVVTNEEINEAMAAARPVMIGGDEIGARMAFRDAYERIIRQSRLAGIRPKWYPSLGFDPIMRVDAIQAAEAKGLLTRAQAVAYLPAVSAADAAQGLALIAGRLTDQSTKPELPKHEALLRITGILTKLKSA